MDNDTRIAEWAEWLNNTNDSLLLLDQAGGMYKQLSSYLASVGYIVKRLSLYDCYSSNSFGLIHNLRDSITDRPEGKKIQRFADAFTAGMSDRIQHKEVINALFALVAWVMLEKLEDPGLNMQLFFNMIQRSTAAEGKPSTFKMIESFLLKSDEEKPFRYYQKVLQLGRDIREYDVFLALNEIFSDFDPTTLDILSDKYIVKVRNTYGEIRQFRRTEEGFIQEQTSNIRFDELIREKTALFIDMDRDTRKLRVSTTLLIPDLLVYYLEEMSKAGAFANTIPGIHTVRESALPEVDRIEKGIEQSGIRTSSISYQSFEELDAWMSQKYGEKCIANECVDESGTWNREKVILKKPASKHFSPQVMNSEYGIPYDLIKSNHE